MPGTNLPPTYRTLREDLQFLKGERDRFLSRGPVERAISDWWGDAGVYKSRFEKEIDLAEKEIHLSLTQPPAEPYAIRLRVQTHLHEARSSWKGYIQATQEGAEGILFGLTLVRNTFLSASAAYFLGPLAFVKGPLRAALAVSALAHAALLTLIPAPQAQPSSQFVFPTLPLAPPEKSPDEEPPKKSEQPSVTDRPKILPRPEEKLPEGGKGTKGPAVPSYQCEQFEFVGETGAVEESGCIDESKKKWEEKVLREIRETPEEPADDPPWRVEYRPVEKKEPAPFSIRSLQELKEEAARALKDLGAPFDYGRFFHEAEMTTSNQPLAEGVKGEIWGRWQKNVSAYRTIPSSQQPPREQIAQLMQLLYLDYLALYKRASANLIDFVREGGGNCEAQTKLIVSAETVSRIQLPPNHVLAVQVYKDHLQAVIFDKKTHRVWEPLTKRWQDAIEAPLYHPKYLLHTFLLGQKTASPVTSRDLLLAEVPSREEPAPKWGRGLPRSNTKHRYPAEDGVGYYSRQAPPPVSQLLTSPYQGVPIPRATGGQGSPSRSAPLEEALARCPEIKPGMLPHEARQQDGSSFTQRYLQEKLQDLKFFQETWVYPTCIVSTCASFGYTSEEELSKCAGNLWRNRTFFAAPADRDHFNSLPTDKEKAAFLMQLSLQALDRFLRRPEFKTLLEVLYDPSLIERQSGTVMDRVGQFLEKIEDVTSRIFQLSIFHYENLVPYSNERMEHIKKFEFSRLRRFQQLDRAIASLKRRVQEKPAAFLSFLDRLPPISQGDFLGLLFRTEYGFSGRDPSENKALRALIRLVADPKRVAIGEPAGYEPFSVKPTPVIEFDLVEIDSKLVPLPDPKEREAPIEASKEANRNRPAKKGVKLSEEKEFGEEHETRHRIRLETFLEISNWDSPRLITEVYNAPYFDGTPTLFPRRWNPRMAEDFLRLNELSSGRWDELFLASYRRIVKGLPPSLSDVPDPLRPSRKVPPEIAKS